MREIRNLLFPVRCPLCDGILNEEERKTGYCTDCRKKIHFVGENYCMKCGKPIKTGSSEYCRDCMKTRHFFTENRAVYIYEGDMKKALYRFKYMNRKDYAAAFAADAEKSLEDYFRSILTDKKIDAILPVPMYAEKLKLRGYNQAEWFAEELGKRLDIPVIKNRLIRVKNTEKMKLLSPEERRKNLNNAFQYIQTGVKLNGILLVDDIYTTGATLDSISEVLLSAGIDNIYSVCVCIGRGT
jgi:ComF family protein